MTEDELKHLWQTQPVPETGADGSVLSATVREKHRKFQRTILWRDFREVGLAILLIPFFLLRGAHNGSMWEHHLIVVALVFIAGFLVIDRLRHRKTAAAPGQSVVDALGLAVSEVEHQIWLLRNVHWWYIGPLLGALMVPDLYHMIRGNGSLSGGIRTLVFNLLLSYGIWKLNQYAVKKDLEPRRDELQKLLEETR
ncbi:hypothetical protein EI77_03764 [Prosthecobacter fusiformis]|uniref:Uncharacterized protein n=1 Tax=Prosthecobacter fusiformis TaxID=48464 RepID=A0A4R7RMK8_9BACT|nr:hypothetical protein [Prosthecobacter fusiformis]TDU66028.1 hypothetical protein EI77_03764 [Prosthecobacter fusiformis]